VASLKAAIEIKRFASNFGAALEIDVVPVCQSLNPDWSLLLRACLGTTTPTPRDCKKKLEGGQESLKEVQAPGSEELGFYQGQ
jgi:hypothetical protein